MKHRTPFILDRRSLTADRGAVGARRRGFTLLELLVALAMVAIVSLSLFQSLRVAIRAKSTAEAAVAPGRSIEVAMDLIRSDIENVVPPNPNSAVSTDSTAASTTTATAYIAGPFVGLDQKDDRGRDGDDLVLYSTSDGPTHDTGDGDIRRIELMVITDSANDHVLVRRVAANLLSPQEPLTDDEVICRGVAGFNLRYYDGTEWSDFWDSSQDNNELPAAVEVTLDLDRKNADGTVDTKSPPLHFVRIFAVSSSSVVNDANATTSGTTGGF